MTRRDKDKSELLSETAPGPSELTRQFADAPEQAPPPAALGELAEAIRQEADALYGVPYAGPPFDPMPRGTLTGYQTETADGVRAYAGSDDREDEMIRQLVHHEQAKPVYEQCPDKGTCHHGCTPGGACFRVLYAGPLSGRYDGDVWPQEMRAEHGQRQHDALAAPRVQVTSKTPTIDVDLTGDHDVVTFRLPTGDVIRVWVNQGNGMLSVESEGSSLAVFPVNSRQIAVM